MTLAELFRQKGLKQGREQGHVQAKAEVARTALKEGLAADMVVRLTGLPLATVEQIRKELGL